MMRSVLLITVYFCMAGCGVDCLVDWSLGSRLGSLPGRISISAEMPLDRGEIIWQGFLDWNDAQWPSPGVLFDAGPDVGVSQSQRGLNATDIDLTGSGNRRSTSVELDTEVDDYTLRLAARHEAGHVLGLAHTDGGIMNAVLTDAEVSRIDIERVWDIYH